MNARVAARRLLWIGVLVAMSGQAGGCGTILGETVALFKGASGVYQEIEPVAPAKDPNALAAYTKFELGQVKDGFAGKVPGGFWNDLETAFSQVREHGKLPDDPGGKTLVVEGEVVYFELRENALGIILGDVEEVVARLELKDKATGRKLGTAMCVGRTTKRVNFGIRKKAQGLAKAIGEWIGAYYPPPPEEKE